MPLEGLCSGCYMTTENCDCPDKKTNFEVTQIEGEPRFRGVYRGYELIIEHTNEGTTRQRESLRKRYRGIMTNLVTGESKETLFWASTPTHGINIGRKWVRDFVDSL